MMDALFWIMFLMLPAQKPRSPGLSPSTKDHIQNLVESFPAASRLRRELLDGALGDGLHVASMDAMRR